MKIEHFDVLVIGAGLSGIGAGCHLRINCPDKRFAILEMRDRIGGTWDLFRYPGIRSDSDMHTLGYAFRPWTQPDAIADGPSILRYIEDTAREYGVDREIRFRHKVLHAAWSSEQARWTVDIERGPDRERAQLSCAFLHVCAGYYNYAQGHAPSFPGIETFQGRVVHPQFWSDDIDYAGKRVVVIGSGATAVTLVPEMARDAAHVTMLQRSPSYVVARPAQDAAANFLRRVLPEKTAYAATRWKNVAVGSAFYQLCRRYPERVKKLLRKGLIRSLGPDYDLRHFTPSYNPWDQRMCAVPDGDLFAAIRDGRAAVVTDHIETFTANGIRLKSGESLEADLVVTATGLDLIMLGGATLTVDGQDVEAPRATIYKGMMLSDVPNLAFAIGYTNAAWTLKCDLVGDYVCRLLKYMDRNGYASCTPRLGSAVDGEPLIDFSSGYVLRAADRLPRQGTRRPWKLHQNYALDVLMLRHGRLTDDMEFQPAASGLQAPDRRAAVG